MKTNFDVMAMGLGPESIELTNHAWKRMSQRSISPEAVAWTLSFGRCVYTKGAAHFAIGRKEVKRYRRQAIDLADLEGMHVICCPKRETVITVYKNRDFRNISAKR